MMKKIWIGCCCFGWLTGISQASDIFKGGSGDGYVLRSYTQASTDFWKGGSGDGHAKITYTPTSTNIWLGGNGDGYALNGYIQPSTSLWLGGSGDGYAKNSYMQTSIGFWLGGSGDGWANKNYLQNSNNFWLGGKGDGWASVYKPQGLLPLTWLKFEVQKWQGKYSLLQWTTASEKNTARFEIERGKDAVNFVKIATVNAAGNTNTPVDYTLYDSLPNSGYNYYRIRQIDADGRFSYSPARLVRFDVVADKLIRIYPNPAHAFVNVEIPEAMRTETVIINIVALSGAVVDHIKVPAGSNSFVRFNISNLARAAYTVHVISTTQSSATRIVVH